MQRDVKELLEFVFGSEQAQPPAYQAALDMLHAYIESELDGKEATRGFPEVKRLMDQSPLFRQTYEDAKAIFLMERQGGLVKPPVEAEFDLSYLDTVAPVSSIWQTVSKAGRQITKLFTEVCLVFSPGKAFFDDLPNPLTAQWQAMPMLRQAGGEKQRVPVLSLPSPEHDLSLGLIVISPEAEELKGTLIIEVARLSSQELVGGARVALRDEEYQLLQSDSTLEDGRVTFANVLLGKYVIEVKFHRRVLQVPIAVRWCASVAI